jgi:hypothetical protein
VFLCRGFSSEIFLLFCSCAWIFFVFLVRARFPSWFSRAYGLIPPQIFFTAQGRTTGSLPVRFSVVVFIQPERARGLDSVARFGFPCSCSRVSHRRSFSPPGRVSADSKPYLRLVHRRCQDSVLLFPVHVPVLVFIVRIDFSFALWISFLDML